MKQNDIAKSNEQQFKELLNAIENKRSEASYAVNEKHLQMAWIVGGYVSLKLKTAEWGSKVVNEFVEYVRVNAPHLKGFSRSSIYNMILFYDEYSSPFFSETISKYLPTEFVQLPVGQIEGDTNSIVQPKVEQLPELLKLTSFTNHISILCNCHSWEERLFYILYAHRERLKKEEVKRVITTNVFSTIVGSKGKLSDKMLEVYPNSPILFKDKLFVDFLGLPQKHTETKMRKAIIQHMKEFILELGKDFLFVDQEYKLPVGSTEFSSDLLFFHRGIQALVAIELKVRPFQPKDLGQLEFYLEALDRDVKRTNENPSVGIILCPQADSTVVEYALSRSMSPAMVAEYKRLLIPEAKMQELLKEYCEYIKENSSKSEQTD